MCSRIANTNQLLYLNGWKEIANYLGKGVRTAQRYERSFALPVRRPSGGSGGAVMATRTEIDTWVSTRQVLTPAAQPPIVDCGEMKQNFARMTQLRRQLAAARTELHTTIARLKARIPYKWEIHVVILESAPGDLLRLPLQEQLSDPLAHELIHAFTSHRRITTRAAKKRKVAAGRSKN